jgi:hypothetical protein
VPSRFSLQSLFADFCISIAKSYPIGRAGIVRSNKLGEEFVLIAQWLADGSQIGKPDRRFDSAGTAGEWVLRNRRGFIGSTIDDVRRFPSTLEDFLDEGMQSNFVEFIDAKGLLLFFALSPVEHAFDDKYELQQKLAVLPHCVQLAEIWESPGVEEIMQSRLGAAFHDLWTSVGVVPTQTQLERAYYESLLSITGGRVDGPQGAARLADVKPGTFRSRIARVRRSS